MCTHVHVCMCALLLSGVVVVVSACVAAGAESLEEVAAGRSVGLVVGELAQLTASAATLHAKIRIWETTKKEEEQMSNNEKKCKNKQKNKSKQGARIHNSPRVCHAVPAPNFVRP